MPMNSDEYTSLVFNANAMATTGGRRDQILSHDFFGVQR